MLSGFKGWTDKNISVWFKKLKAWDYKPYWKLERQSIERMAFLIPRSKRVRTDKWLVQHLSRNIPDAANQGYLLKEFENLIQENDKKVETYTRNFKLN